LSFVSGAQPRVPVFLEGHAATRSYHSPGRKKTPSHQVEKRWKTRALLIFPKPIAWAGIGTWSLQIALQPVAVVSSGQSLNHSEW